MVSAFPPFKKGYGKLWDDAKVAPTKKSVLNSICVHHILPYKTRYQEVEKKIGVPWFWVAVVHTREASNNFARHLHNGDPLRGYTYHVPKGRPKVGHPPPFTWEESANDALTMAPHTLDKVTVWSVERMLYEQERYNGFGYLRVKENSPYVWAMTSEQQRGKYVADGRFDPGAWDTQPGTAGLMLILAELDEEVHAGLQTREATPPAEVIVQETYRGRVIRNSGVGAGALAATGAATTTPISFPDMPKAAMGAEAAVGLVGVIAYAAGQRFVKRKTKLLMDKWVGVV